MVEQNGTQDGRRSKLDVIVPFDDMFVRSMGQRLHLSFIDAHAINQLYCRSKSPHKFQLKVSLASKIDF